MSFEKQLREIERIQFLKLPKRVIPPHGVPDAEVEIEAADTYQLRCSHLFYPPASVEELASTERQLSWNLPQQLVELLSISNGADLFRIHYASRRFDDYWIPKYKILSTSELTSVNLQLLDTFHSYIEGDDDYSNDASLDYIAFCDVGDGNFLALLMEGEKNSFVFYLDHDYAYYPYRDIKSEGAYSHIADSLKQWFDLLIQSSGRAGIGVHFFHV